MSMLFGWLAPGEDERASIAVATDMLSALRVQAAQPAAITALPGLVVGALETPGLAASSADLAPARSDDGRFHLWFAGEAFVWRGATWSGEGARRSRSATFRRELLNEVTSRGMGALRLVDGEFFVALWDSLEQRLTLANDRFGGLPHYWAANARGFAFAGGVRGVLMAPGVGAEPDPEAIREAVSFGGYRLGSRTNVTSTKMLPGACVQEVALEDVTRPRLTRYWTWSDLRVDHAGLPLAEVQGRLSELWRRAVTLRLDGASSPGQTLSGGLDSRAILAEAGPRAPRWTAITYGLPDCDDARFAQRAAAIANATWVFHPLYSGRDPDWFDRRTGHVQETDGLIELSDLMHLEALPLQAGLIDVTLPGYIGDAVVGPTFGDIDSAERVLAGLPYYGTPLGLTGHQALLSARALIDALGAAAPRFAVFEHKFPQSTNRWSAAWRPWLKVRKPFTDHAFFDFAQSLTPSLRGPERVYERWLLRAYPAHFESVPHQKTGVPILSPPWKLALVRGRRAITRRVADAIGAKRPLRQFHDNERAWAAPAVRQRIEDAVLRPGSLVGELFGPPAIRALFDAWFRSGGAPAQVIAALVVFELYHRDLGAFLRARRTTPGVSAGSAAAR